MEMSGRYHTILLCGCGREGAQTLLFVARLYIRIFFYIKVDVSCKCDRVARDEERRRQLRRVIIFFGTLAGRPPPTNKSQAIPLLGTLWYHHCTIPPTISLATRYHIIPYHSYPPICTMPTDAACSLPLGSCCMGIPIKLHYTFLLLLVAQIFFAVRQYENFSYTLLIFVLYG